MGKNIKNIIFDLGNVIVDLDLDRTNRLFEEMLGADYQAIFRELEELDLFHRFEKGQMSNETFIWTIQHTTQKISRRNLSPQEIIRCWNGMLLSIPLERLKFLEALRKDYKVFLYSNTNAIHLQWVYAYLIRNYEIRDFDRRYFDKPYYSHQIHHRKPDTSGYEFLLKDAGLLAEESFFIDDNADNIQGAKDVGILTYHHPIGLEITKVFESEIQKFR
ncbi:MAG: HAD family phosphatase [Saprospiraceae bacterium]